MTILIVNQSPNVWAGSISDIQSTNTLYVTISNGDVSWSQSSNSITFHGMNGAVNTGVYSFIAFIGFFSYAAGSTGDMCSKYVSSFPSNEMRTDVGF